MQVYERTENGVTATVSQADGRQEINHAMMGGRSAVRTMSSITRTDYAIEYKDGRKVRLVLIDEPCGNRWKYGKDVCAREVGHVGPHRNTKGEEAYSFRWFDSEGTTAAKSEADDFNGRVVSVRGGKVHTAMPGVPEGRAYPLCRGGGMNQMLTKFTATTAPLSCKTCTTYAERRAVKKGA
ncbi:hypothetical protein AB0I84_18835 [Streptomyces spectabilis]|uniref:hypothetical protein n=1 Tax=Streptomyces spectabilis TaxID=68270 RepID=UPI0033CDD5D0